ncbi:MAG TPA: tetratricopeptide repeat protein [Bacteroidota bacterium]|nr:tetratricopeptide repeat protein [Bacteroidota bacterium]
MNSKYILLIGVLLLAGVVVVAVMRKSPSLGAAPPSSKGFSSSTPSKENASKSVVEQINHLKDVVKKDSTSASVNFELAQLLQDAHRPSEATEYYARGLALDPSNTTSRIDYSLCLYEVGRIPEAMDQNHRVLRKHPSNPEALYNLGALYANTGRNDSARVYWGKLLNKHAGHELATKARENLKQLPAASPAM